MSSPTIHPARQASPWYLAVPRLTVVHTLALLVALGASPVRAADTDGDGLDDDWEQALAELYRPIMRFDALEDHWPSSARWVAERSKLRTASNCSLTDDRSRATDVFSEAELAENPMRALRADERGFDPSNYAFATFSEDCFTLDLIDQSSARGGEGGVTNPNRVEGDPVVLPSKLIALAVAGVAIYRTRQFGVGVLAGYLSYLLILWVSKPF